MTIKPASQPNARDHAADLLRQRATLRNAEERRSSLEARVRACERRYGIESDSIHAAIERGKLQETHEVCRWIIDYDLLRRTETQETW